ncbi:hypothetical protein ILUMI_27100 [Ignelater luminosus]|uniref:Uncharacterized protein n=1 Tax=Ignelater luminosus TaxID=2038154 RepID=A0A8K0C3B8_IGNLU|nr:hypothetical protein ILUMI_27100 [Ignelater luminosus]
MHRDFRDKFYNDGFVVIEDFLTETEINKLKEEADNLIKNMPEQSSRAVFSTTTFDQNKNQYFADSADKVSYFFETGALGPEGELLVDPNLSLNKIGHALHVLNEDFRKVTFDERVKESCFQLGYEDPVVVQSMYIFKNPGIGGIVTPHQDSTFLNTEPESLVGFWIALDDATTENGCLWFARGSHKGGVHRRYMRNAENSSNELFVYDKPAPHYQKSSFTAVPVRKGTCILIHGRVVHFSEANKSDKPRNAYTFHVLERSSKYSEDNWLQQTEESPFLSMYKN